MPRFSIQVNLSGNGLGPGEWASCAKGGVHGAGVGIGGRAGQGFTKCQDSNNSPDFVSHLHLIPSLLP